MKYYDLALARVYTGGRLYTYKSTTDLKVGSIVQVPYGQKNVSGVVIKEVKKPTFSAKEITNNSGLVLPQTSLDLLNWMVNFYIDDIGQIVGLFVQDGKKIVSKDIESAPNIGKGEVLPIPTNEQKSALAVLSKTNKKKFLLHGETGSGKTRVFIEKAIDTINNKQSVLILTPEIGLTSQLFLDFITHVKAPIVVNHSDLPVSKRKNLWLRSLNETTPTVYIGPRSTLFLPISNIGLVVVDECHDSSYKQGQSPKYNALHIASQLANYHEAQLIYSTATPNVDDYYKFKELKYEIIRLEKPAVGKHPHFLNVIDQKNRQLFSKNYYLSDPLIEACNKAIKANEQILLFLNRRGSARLVQCNTCGYIYNCPNCGIPLIFHHDQNLLICHSCNFKAAGPRQCPSCGGVDLQFSIPGTKNLFKQISQIFPSANIARFDTDLHKQDKIQENITQIKSGQIEIVVGTQMISKGLDLPKLSVVGVIDADSGLNLPDFSAEEVAFQQLYQVTGRATRGYIATNSFIQTKNPNHPIIHALKERNWHNFYEYELAKRHKYKYPPFCYLATIKTKNKAAQKAKAASDKIYVQLDNFKGISVLGPSPSFFEKQNNLYHWQIILKSSKRTLISEAIKQLKGDFVFDIDPISLL